MANTKQDAGVEQDPTAGAVQNDTGLDGNAAGAVSYLLGFITGLIVFLLKSDNRFARWHAAQSMAFSAVLIGVYVVLSVVQIVLTAVMFSGSSGGFVLGSIVSLILGLVWLVLAVGGFVAWVFLMIKAYQGDTPRMPVAAGIADRIA